MNCYTISMGRVPGLVRGAWRHTSGAIRLDYVLHKFAAVGRWLHREFVAAWPVFMFFSIGFLLLLTIVKLVLANFSIEMTALSKAVIGALFAAKAVLILDGTPLERHLERYRRIVAVTVKTLIYGLITLLLGFSSACSRRCIGNAVSTQQPDS